MAKAGKQRLDVLLVERGLAPTRERAQALIMAGKVLVAEVPHTKAGQTVARDAPVRVSGEDHPYVSRGGVKLAAALDHFAIDVTARVVLDAGASTGGFTDCVLQRGARRVYAVDVGYGQLAEKLRQDARVAVRDRANVRNLKPDEFNPRPDLLVADLSFISLQLVLPALFGAVAPAAPFVLLVKPQFEAGRSAVGKGGIVRDAAARAAAVAAVEEKIGALGGRVTGSIESPITGTKGNVEFLTAGFTPAAHKRGQS